jgi:hypothetical protein
VQRVHVDDPAKVVRVCRVQAVEISAPVNLVALYGRLAHGLDLYLHVLPRQVLVDRYFLIGDDVVARALLKGRLLKLDAELMFMVADGCDLAPAPVAVEADNAEAGESHKCCGGAFLYGHDFLLWLSSKSFQLRVRFRARNVTRPGRKFRSVAKPDA